CSIVCDLRDRARRPDRGVHLEGEQVLRLDGLCTAVRARARALGLGGVAQDLLVGWRLQQATLDLCGGAERLTALPIDLERRGCANGCDFRVRNDADKAALGV